jgi:flagellar basal body-associated protein FliL
MWTNLTFTASYLISAATRRRPKTKLLIAIVAGVAGVLLLGAIGCGCFWRNRKRKKVQAKTTPSTSSRGQRQAEDQIDSEEDVDLPLFNLDVILAATDNFSVNCKIGQGGFGSVYMVG